MIGKVIQALLRIKNYDRIPKLPRGMLAGEYDGLSRDDQRVLARFGARDPMGIRVRMKRAGVDTVEELVSQLEHYQPMRHIKRRLRVMAGRWLRATDYHPHREEILAGARQNKKTREQVEAEQRLKQLMRQYEKEV